MNEDSKRLLKNLLALTIVVLAVFLVFRYLFNSDENELEIDDTPIRIESVRTIAEISVVSYSDEVVMDTVERYQGESSLFDPRDWVKWYNDSIQRRLTLIVKGEIKYGLDLSEGNYKVDSNIDTIWLSLPNPKILDVIISPSKTEVFHERGKWDDSVRQRLEMHAKDELRKNAETLKLEDKARENSIRLFKKLISSQKKLIIQFDESN